MRILVLASEDNCTAQMARGWLYWSNPNLQVYTAGVYKAGSLDAKAVAVMKEAGVDISHYPCDKVERFLADNWDFVISVEGEALLDVVKFTGWIGAKVAMVLPDPSKLTGPEEAIDVEYLTARNEIRSRMFDFYLRQTLGRDMLGADSCGADCDL